MINRTAFYQIYRQLFENKLTQGQVNGFERLFDEWEDKIQETEFCLPVKLYPQLAYILATVYHETGKLMLPVREGFATSDAQAIRMVTRMYERGQISRNYAIPDSVTGQSYFGRGLIQLTWKDNYQYADSKLGLKGELVNNPDKALEPVIGAKIAVHGMYEGWFVKDPSADMGVVDRKDLWDYIDPNRTMKDYFNSRRIVNGLDCAGKIQGYAERFEKCIVEMK